MLRTRDCLFLRTRKWVIEREREGRIWSGVHRRTERTSARSLPILPPRPPLVKVRPHFSNGDLPRERPFVANLDDRRNVYFVPRKLRNCLIRPRWNNHLRINPGFFLSTVNVSSVLDKPSTNLVHGYYIFGLCVESSVRNRRKKFFFLI